MQESLIDQKLNSFDRLINTDELSATIGVPRRTIHLWVRQNRIPHVRVLGCLKYDPQTIKRWLAQTTIAA
jgi:excisionase family DNA binding protein